MVLIGSLAVSTIWTLWHTTYAELLADLEFPSAELEFLAEVPAQGWHLALFMPLPQVATLGLIVYSRGIGHRIHALAFEKPRPRL